MMYPVTERRIDKFLNSGRFELNILHEGVSSFTVTVVLIVLLKLVVVDRRDVSSGTNSSNLCSQVVDLSAGERRVTDHRSLQISGDELLDPSRAHDLSGGDGREFGPLCSRLVAHEVGLFVAAGTRLFFGDDWGRFVVWSGEIVVVSFFCFLSFLLS